VVKKLVRSHKVVVVTGGGKTAREYISGLKKFDVKTQCWVGIASTKLNARLVAGYLGLVSPIPDSLSEVVSSLRKRNLVVCGALGFQPNMTSDGDAAQIAARIKADYFVNLTNVDGLFDKNPKKFRSAKFISTISFKDFNSIVSKINYKAGQHFVLDQVAAKVIRRSKIKTVIMNGYKLANLGKLIRKEKYKGTLIS
jgi:uridylate kinase